MSTKNKMIVEKNKAVWYSKSREDSPRNRNQHAEREEVLFYEKDRPDPAGHDFGPDPLPGRLCGCRKL